MLTGKIKFRSLCGCLALGAAFMIASGQLTVNAQTINGTTNKLERSPFFAKITKKPVSPENGNVVTLPSASQTTTKAKTKAAADWDGLYVGGYGGYTFGRSNVRTTTIFTAQGYFTPTSIDPIAAAGAQKVSPKGFDGGGTIGYNHQSGNYVFGVEADFGLMKTKNSSTSVSAYVCCAQATFAITQTVKTLWMATARPRFGWMMGNLLFYGTGGLAVTDLNYSSIFTDVYPPALASESGSIKKILFGWTAGGGAEYKLNKKWSIKGEYLYADFRRATGTSTNLVQTAFTPPAPEPTNVFTHSADLKLMVARFGINYHF